MIRSITFLVLMTVTTLYFSNDALASRCQSSTELENNWAKVRYQSPENLRILAFKTLLVTINEDPLECLQSAEYQIIEAMIKGSMAKQQSRFAAIKNIKQIKRHLDKAIKKDPTAMNGLAWTLLGLLYDKSPGWPLSLGDDEKADQMYQKGLKYNPDGMDANYYYGDFLRRKGIPEKARHYLQKANNAKQIAGYEIAYQGRSKDIQRSLAKLTP